MALLRVLGWLLLLAGLIVLGRDLIALREAAQFSPLSLYALWYEIARSSLYRLEALLAPYLWRMLSLGLRVWAAPVLLLPGLILLWLGRKRSRGRRSTRYPS